MGRCHEEIGENSDLRRVWKGIRVFLGNPSPRFHPAFGYFVLFNNLKKREIIGAGRIWENNFSIRLIRLINYHYYIRLSFINFFPLIRIKNRTIFILFTSCWKFIKYTQFRKKENTIFEGYELGNISLLEPSFFLSSSPLLSCFLHPLNSYKHRANTSTGTIVDISFSCRAESDTQKVARYQKKIIPNYIYSTSSHFLGRGEQTCRMKGNRN